MIKFDPKTQTIVVDTHTGKAWVQSTATHWMAQQMAKLKEAPVKYEHSSFVPQRPSQRDVMVGWDGV